MKIERHDNSLTEQEKKEFRNSETWRNFRKQKFTEQNGKDFVTGEPLLSDFNCHHLCMKSNEYTHLSSDRFVALNRETHKMIHELFNSTDWKTKATNEKIIQILTKMEELNDDIEVNLHRNAYNYTMIDSNNKQMNCMLAKKLHYPVNNYGMMQWNSYYIPKEVPQETRAWVRYMATLNGKENVLLLLELRHLNLYSSYRNFRNNPKANERVKRECLKELNTTTDLLNLWNSTHNK